MRMKKKNLERTEMVRVQVFALFRMEADHIQ